jgi:hypothetical protein
MSTSNKDKAQFGPRTMVDATSTRGDQASNVLCGSVVFDASILLQSNGTRYKFIAEHQSVNHL